MPSFRSLLPVVALSILAAGSAHAAASKDPAAAAPGAYELDTRHTSVIWKVGHLGFSNFVGRFDQAQGTLNYDPVDPTKSTVKVTIDPASMYTNVPDFAKELTGPEWVDAAKGPITFTSTKVTKTGPTTGTVAGDLTLNGVTKPVVLDVTFVGGGVNDFAKANAIGFSGKTTIKRSDFGVTKLVPMVTDEVEVGIETEFLQKTPASANQ